MDIKNNEYSHLADGNGRGNKVVIGLSGGVNSLVAAYLLKIQKYDLVAVTVSPVWEGYRGDTSKALACSLTPENIQSITDFCHQLNIPHVTLRPASDFKELVVEKWMSSRLSGQKNLSCWNCHDLRMQIMFEKMKELGAEHLATGHFGKIFRQETSGSVCVHTSNDDQYDESELLHRLPHEILNVLMLPLSDLQKKEVQKLAENFGITGVEPRIKIHECFNSDEESMNYLSRSVPDILIKGGDITTLTRDQIFGAHEGVVKYIYGQPLNIPGTKQGEESFFYKYIPSEKTIEIGSSQVFMKESVLLTNCKIDELTSLVEPVKGFVRHSTDSYIDCMVYPKSLNAIHLKFEGPHRMLEGEILSVFKKKGKNAKILVSGTVQFLPISPNKES